MYQANTHPRRRADRQATPTPVEVGLAIALLATPFLLLLVSAASQ
jgi:hypothetical protein